MFEELVSILMKLFIKKVLNMEQINSFGKSVICREFSCWKILHENQVPSEKTDNLWLAVMYQIKKTSFQALSEMSTN